MISKRRLKVALSVIEQADDDEIKELELAICRNQNRKYPHEEVLFLSLPRHDRAERARVLELFCEFAKNHPPED